MLNFATHNTFVNPNPVFTVFEIYQQTGNAVTVGSQNVVINNGTLGSALQVTVNNVAPDVDAGADETLLPTVVGAFSRTVSFVDPGTQDDHDVTINFGDGTGNQTFSLPAGDRNFNLNHTFTADGVYTVSVTVKDDDLGTHTDTFEVTVLLNTPPKADAGGPYTNDEGSALTLDATASTDEQNNITGYAWDLDGDSQFDDAFGVNPTLTGATLLALGLGDDGVYPVAVEVTDAFGATDIAATTITIANVAPSLVNLTVTPAINEDDFATLSGEIVDPGTLDEFTLVVNWGEGADETISVPAGSTSFSVSHQYLDDNPTATPSDTYDVTIVSFADDDGGSDSSHSAQPTDVIVNGTFATGDFTGWNVGIDPTRADGGRPFAVDVGGDGWLVGNSSLLPGLSAFNGFDGGVVGSSGPLYEEDLEFFLNQPITVGGPLSSALLSFQFDVAGGPAFSLSRSGAPTEDRVFSVRATDSSGNVLSTFYSYTVAGTTTDSNPIQNVSIDISSQLNALGAGNYLLEFHELIPQYFTGGGRFAIDDISLEIAEPVVLAVTVNNVAPVASGLTLNSSTINEDGSVTVSGSFTDVGIQDTHTVMIDWGDGTSSPATVTQAAGTGTFTATHQYLDDDPTATSSDNYTITATVTDDDGGTDSASATLTVNNVAPTLVLDPVVAIDENGVATLTGTISDPGTLDTFTLDINWGDALSPNDTETYSFSASASGTQTFTLTHQYLDDNPAGDPSNVYTIGATVTDDDTGVGSNFETVTVNNVAPTVVIDSVVAIDENGVATLTGTITDPGTLDTFTLDINWGDALNPNDTETYSFSASATGSQTFTLTHQYLDDNPTGDPSNVYTIAATVTDDDTGIGSDSETVTVNNVAPEVAVSLSDSIIDEDGSTTLSGTITDPGTLDTFTLDLNWGDPLSPDNIQTFSLGNSVLTVAVDGIDWNPATREFSLDHQFLDDNPSVSAFDDYTISVTVTDDDTGVGNDSANITVNNVAPANLEIDNPVEHCGNGTESEPITIDLDFTDPGSLDEHTVTIDWGDGNTDVIVMTVGDRALSVDHTYAAGGVYYVDVTLEDDDSGVDTASTVAIISGVSIQEVNGEQVLQIIGTAGEDHISVNQTGNGLLKVHWDLLGDDPRVFNLADVERIMSILCDGDDHLTISGKVTLPSIIDAGAGNDHVNGGAGINIILGGDGDDHLNGGDARDILIGGEGADRLVGGPGYDLMTGGVYTNGAGDQRLLANYDSLLAAQNRWLDDIDDILSGDEDPEDDAVLAAFYASVGDDNGAEDKITGSSGFDWLLLFEGDRFTDQSSNGNGNGGGKGKNK
ncbi:PKD domain-containing protein [Fuerstiella marisgermanici]|uniref:Poly(Beta-D-mannuronate) C5 epimerase n=1 Tax=Fuerstiella marisgermanici TaxID=1891926 RepID=A0A1P8WQR5_9PLAN|nr:PKD domain-containing protein [Fuerstiella marisgermanici]APZ96400.1 Poly(beta-D-mannuronate) C5 epimerase [Fuerstiella marisgermanici]